MTTNPEISKREKLKSSFNILVREEITKQNSQIEDLDNCHEQLQTELENQMRALEEHHRQQIKDLEREQTQELEDLRALEREIRIKQKDLMKDVRNVKELLESREENKSKLLKSSFDSLDQQVKLQNCRIEIFQACKSHPMGILHPRIGLSESSLSWYDVIRNAIIHEMKDFDNFIRHERTLTSVGQILPNRRQIWKFTEFFEVEKTKVVILGQDPYHTPDVADGLAFSVKRSRSDNFPPSLRRIFEALQQDSDINFQKPYHGDLSYWCEQGVLLLDTYLTVRKGCPNSHSDKNVKVNKGWGHITDAIVRHIGDNYIKVVFMLWGFEAQKKEALINKDNQHLILKSCHPTKFVYEQDKKNVVDEFLNCGHFSKCNEFLEGHGYDAIDWQI